MFSPPFNLLKIKVSTNQDIKDNKNDNCNEIKILKTTSFREKNEGDGNRINAGYMVLQPEIFDFIDGDDTIFEKEPLEKAALQNQLTAYKHDGFWQCMDTKREKDRLEKLWKSGNAPWKVWE